VAQSGTARALSGWNISAKNSPFPKGYPGNMLASANCWGIQIRAAAFLVSDTDDRLYNLPLDI